MGTSIETGGAVERVPMSEIRSAYGPGEGRHWFDRDTLRFFGSRLPRFGYRGPGGCYFVSSERDRGTIFDGELVAVWDGKRRYTVRRLVETGRIETVEGLGEWSSPVAADAEARRLAAGGAS